MAPTLPPEVRAAQRSIIAIVRLSGVLNRDGLALWRVPMPESARPAAGDTRRRAPCTEMRAASAAATKHNRFITYNGLPTS
ncbi:hypothetical protein ACN6K9_003591 [Streptomyces sp. SAS_267]